MRWAGLDRKRLFAVWGLSASHERDAVEQIGCYQVAGKCLAKGWILGLAVADDAEWDGRRSLDPRSLFLVRSLGLFLATLVRAAPQHGQPTKHQSRNMSGPIAGPFSSVARNGSRASFIACGDDAPVYSGCINSLEHPWLTRASGRLDAAAVLACLPCGTWKGLDGFQRRHHGGVTDPESACFGSRCTGGLVW